MPGELAIVGFGLIGASFALAARGSFDRLVVLDPDPDHARSALERGIAAARVEEVPPTATAVLLACPSDRIAAWLERLAEHPATVFDTGSVKGAILDEVQARLGRVPGNYVPAHPIAGLERSGPGAADAELFAGRTVIVTPVATTEPERLQQVIGYWKAVGAQVEQMDPAEHDRVYARMSHLPHLLAFAYLQRIGSGDLAHAGGGFRDFSRIGASDPEMWSAIFDRNREPLLEALAAFESDLAEFRQAIETGDRGRLKALIGRARSRREQLE